MAKIQIDRIACTSDRRFDCRLKFQIVWLFRPIGTKYLQSKSTPSAKIKSRLALTENRIWNYRCVGTHATVFKKAPPQRNCTALMRIQRKFLHNFRQFAPKKRNEITSQMVASSRQRTYGLIWMRIRPDWIRFGRVRWHIRHSIKRTFIFSNR